MSITPANILSALSAPPPPGQPTAELEAVVRAGLARRQQAVSEQDVARLVKALQRLQPAALAALTSTCEAGGTGTGTEDDAQTAFADTLRSLAA